MNTNALFQLSYGLYVAASKFDTKMNGCIVNTVMQVTSNPLQIAVSINKDNLTCEIAQKIKNAFHFYTFRDGAFFTVSEFRLSKRTKHR